MEYKDPTTGKTYYSDGLTSSWEKPAALEIKQSQIQQQQQPHGGTTTSATAKPPMTFATREEAESAFRALLQQKHVGPTTKWSEVVKLCSSNATWNACSQSLSTGSRKQILAEYQAKKAKEEKEQKRTQLQSAKREFRELLSQTLTSTSSSKNPPNYTEYKYVLEVNSNRSASTGSSYANIAILDEITKQELFYEYIEEIRKREERIYAAKKKATQEAFIEFLMEKKLHASHTWASFRASLSPQDFLDPRFQVSAEPSSSKGEYTLTDLDRQILFSMQLTELQHQQEEQLRHIREERRRSEQRQQDSFREYLVDLARQGVLGITSRWHSPELTMILREAPAYIQVVEEQDPQIARDIFEDFIQDMREAYLREYPLLQELTSMFSVQATTTYEEFCNSLIQAASTANSSITSSQSSTLMECKRVINRKPISSALLLYHELIAKCVAASVTASSSPHHRFQKEDESEDEGEIVE
jgi:pre-mRNA-processing factor 40